MAYFRASTTADNTGGVTYQTPTAAHPPYLTVTGDGARAVSRRRRREPTREDEFEGRGRGDLAPLRLGASPLYLPANPCLAALSWVRVSADRARSRGTCHGRRRDRGRARPREATQVVLRRDWARAVARAVLRAAPRLLPPVRQLLLPPPHAGTTKSETKARCMTQTTKRYEQ